MQEEPQKRTDAIRSHLRVGISGEFRDPSAKNKCPCIAKFESGDEWGCGARHEWLCSCQVSQRRDARADLSARTRAGPELQACVVRFARANQRRPASPDSSRVSLPLASCRRELPRAPETTPAQFEPAKQTPVAPFPAPPVLYSPPALFNPHRPAPAPVLPALPARDAPLLPIAPPST